MGRPWSGKVSGSLVCVWMSCVQTELREDMKGQGVGSWNSQVRSSPASSTLRAKVYHHVGPYPLGVRVCEGTPILTRSSFSDLSFWRSHIEFFFLVQFAPRCPSRVEGKTNGMQFHFTKS